MPDRATTTDREGLSSEQLAEEQAQDLPDREAMSVLGLGNITGGLPVPIDTNNPLPPIQPPSPPTIEPPSPPAIPIPANISPQDAATLASVAGDLNEVSADVQGIQGDVGDIEQDVEEIVDPTTLLA
jgi:hypothetical protein